MSDPTSSNLLLAEPLRGADSGTWDVPMNANTTAIDGLFGGVVTVSLSNSPVTLTAPSGVVTPSAGPFQSQNRILKFTGALSSDVKITLPLPGEYTVQNLTTGAHVVTFAAAGAGNVVATPQGSIMNVWNDGTDAWLMKNQIPGALTFMGGVSAVPAWISACTIAPYLLCDGTVYNISSYPALGSLYGATFGGNGGSTFGVEDLRGRVPLAYDGTGTRITAAGCGINGQTLGAAQDKQTNTLITANLPAYTPTGLVGVTRFDSVFPATSTGGANNGILTGSQVAATSFQNILNPSTPAFTGNAQGGTSTPVNNVQPAQVSGIWLVST